MYADQRSHSRHRKRQSSRLTGLTHSRTQRIARRVETVDYFASEQVEGRDTRRHPGVPAIEVHLSDVDKREQWRRQSVIADLVTGRVAGKGPDGYRDALEMLRRELGVEPPTAA